MATTKPSAEQKAPAPAGRSRKQRRKSGRAVDLSQNPDTFDNTTFDNSLDLSTTSGRVWSYAVTASELRLVLKNDKDRVYTLENTALHYPSVLSMIITAAVRDEKVTVGTSALVNIQSGDKHIVTFGLGTDPIVE